MNYRSGEVSVFGTGRFHGGWNGGGSVSASTGFIFDLGNDNSGYSGGAGGGSLLFPTPVPKTSIGIYGEGGNSTMTIGATVSAALLGRVGFGASGSHAVEAAHLPRFSTFTAADWVIYTARRLCD